MAVDLKRDTVLSRFRAALGEVYGGVRRGSSCTGPARGDDRPDPDYDIAVLLRDMPGRTKEMQLLADLETDILYVAGALINALPFPLGAERERPGCAHKLRDDGGDRQQQRPRACAANCKRSWRRR